MSTQGLACRKAAGRNRAERESANKARFRASLLGAVGVIIVGVAASIKAHYWPDLDRLQNHLVSNVAGDLPFGSTSETACRFLQAQGFTECTLYDRQQEIWWPDDTPQNARFWIEEPLPAHRHFPYDLPQYEESIYVDLWFSKDRKLIKKKVNRVVAYHGDDTSDVVPPRWAYWVSEKLFG